MTLMTMMSTATPKVTPSAEIRVITETNVRLGRRYRSASSSSNGNRDIRPQTRQSIGRCQRNGGHDSILRKPQFYLNDLFAGQRNRTVIMVFRFLISFSPPW